MKRPIKARDIIKGDLIRKEYGCEIVNGETALEYRATSDAHGKGGPGQHFLLDRPEPAVELPTEPTLGWATYRIDDHGEATRLGVTFNAGSSMRLTNWDISVPASRVTAFTPATAVSTEALDRLRVDLFGDPSHGQLISAVARFLTAVDSANGATS